MRFTTLLTLIMFFFAPQVLAPIAAEAASARGDDFYGSIFVGTLFITHDQAGSFDRSAVNVNMESVSRRYETESEAGYYVGGSFGGWINGAQRIEISVGYRSYGTKFQGVSGSAQGHSAEGDINVIPIMVNSYFYPLYFWNDAVPAMAQNFYLGFGVGVGLWDFDASGITPHSIVGRAIGLLPSMWHFTSSYSDTQSVLLQGSLGYEFYLGDLEEFGMAIPDRLDGMSFGVNYQFIWGNPKPEGTRGYINANIFRNEKLHQRSHALLFTARYDF